MPRILFVIGLLSLSLLAPAAARAASGSAILKDCADGQIDGSYSRGELGKAKKNIPSDLDEYSDCRSAIDQARTEGSSGSDSGSSRTGGGSGGSGGTGGGDSNGGAGNDAGATSAGSSADTSDASPSSGTGSSGATGPAESPDGQGAAERAALADAARSGGSPVRVGRGPVVRPGSDDLPAGDAASRSVPEPLLVVLILLGTVALVGAILGARARVLTRRLT